MNKLIMSVSITVFGIAGGYIPYLFGDKNPLGGWSLLLGAVGGFFGIWVAVWLSKRLS